MLQYGSRGSCNQSKHLYSLQKRLHVRQYLLHWELVGGVGAAGAVGATGAVGAVGATGAAGTAGATGAYQQPWHAWRQQEQWMGAAGATGISGGTARHVSSNAKNSMVTQSCICPWIAYNPEPFQWNGKILWSCFAISPGSLFLFNDMVT